MAHCAEASQILEHDRTLTARAPVDTVAASAPAAAASGRADDYLVVPGTARTADKATRKIALPLAPSLERRRLQSHLIMLILDAVAILASFALISRFWYGTFFDGNTVRLADTILPLYWTAALGLQVYSTRSLIHLRFAQRRAMGALLLAMAILLFVAFLAKASATYSRVNAGGGLAVALVALVAVRALAGPLLLRRLGPNAVNLLVLDDGGVPAHIPHAFHVDTRKAGLVPDLNDPHMLDRIGMFMANMDRVLVSCPPERRMAWALIFKGANVQGEIVDPQVYELGALGARRGDGFGALLVSTGPLGLRDRIAKRLFDLAFAGAALLVLAPVLGLVALAIKLEDRGPVLFTQPRTGRNNRFFTIFKFRSMRSESADRHGDRSASRDDDRITRVGRLIRSTSIDELPQLFNVLLGDMSVVGPRPHAIGSQAGDKLFWEVDHRYWLRHSLKPGLTGLAQVRGLRGATEDEADLSGRLHADLEYVSGWSLWRDMRIIVATIRVLVHERAF